MKEVNPMNILKKQRDASTLKKQNAPRTQSNRPFSSVAKSGTNLIHPPFDLRTSITNINDNSSHWTQNRPPKS